MCFCIIYSDHTFSSHSSSHIFHTFTSIHFWVFYFAVSLENKQIDKQEKAKHKKNQVIMHIHQTTKPQKLKQLYTGKRPIKQNA